MARADAGRLLVRVDVLERSRTTYAIEPIEPFRAKGKSELVRVGAVGAPVGERELEAVGLFVGRDRERHVARRVAGSSRGARRASRLLQRGSGLGKTRLLASSAPEQMVSVPSARSARSSPLPSRTLRPGRSFVACFSSGCMRLRARQSGGSATRSRRLHPISFPGCRSSVRSSGSSSSRLRRPWLSIRSSHRRSSPGSSPTCSTHSCPTRLWSSSTTSISWMRHRPS